MTDYLKVRLKVNPQDYDRLREMLIDPETGNFDLDRIYPTPKSLLLSNPEKFLIEKDGKISTLDWEEYAIQHYLKSLRRKELIPVMIKLYRMPRGEFFRSTANKICHGMRKTFSYDRVDKETAEQIFASFIEENGPIKNGETEITTIDEYGAVLLENVLEYGEYSPIEWRTKNRGAAYSTQKIGTNGYDSFYFKEPYLNPVQYIKTISKYTQQGSSKIIIDATYCDELYKRFHTANSNDRWEYGAPMLHVKEAERFKEEYERALGKDIDETINCRITVPPESFEEVKQGIINPATGKIDLKRIYPTPPDLYIPVPESKPECESVTSWQMLAASLYFTQLLQNKDTFEQAADIVDALDERNHESPSLTVIDLLNTIMQFSPDPENIKAAVEVFNNWISENGPIVDNSQPEDSPKRQIRTIEDLGRKTIENVIRYGEYLPERWQTSTYGVIGEIENSIAVDEKGFYATITNSNPYTFTQAISNAFPSVPITLTSVDKSFSKRFIISHYIKGHLEEIENLSHDDYIRNMTILECEFKAIAESNSQKTASDIEQMFTDEQTTATESNTQTSENAMISQKK